MDRVELKNWAKEKINGNKGQIWMGVLIVAIISFLFSFGTGIISGIFGENSVIASIFGLVVELLTLPLSVGLISYMINFVKTEEFDRDLIFKPYEDVFKIIGTMVVMGIIVALGMIVFIIPGIYLAFSYALVPYILATNKDLSITETLALSRKMMDGHKMDYFVLSLSFIGWVLLAPFTLGILFIWLYPYMMTATTKFAVDVMDSYEE